MSAEVLAFFDGAGRRLGSKTRDEVHRDGNWHWLVFVWCAWLRGADPVLLLQQRGRPGDPFVRSLDAPAGGHVMASESHRQAGVREFEEEAGILLGERDLHYLGATRLEGQERNCPRVIQHSYLVIREIGLEEVSFSEESDGFLHAPLKPLLRLLQGETESVEAAVRYAGGGGEPGRATVTGEAFARYPPDIAAVIAKSLRAIELYLAEGRVDPLLWK